MDRVIMAMDDFYETYQFLPGASTNAADAIVTTNQPLMAALLGLGSAEDENPKRQNFISDDTTTEDEVSGLIRTSEATELIDPWGQPYHILMNYDNDNQLRIKAFPEDIVLYDRRLVAWSAGPDGKSGTPETDEDNIYSWDRK